MSPKNKGKFGKGKTQVEEADEFVSGAARLAQRLRPHAFGIAVAVLLVTVLLIGVTVYRWLGDRKARAATDNYAKVVETTRRDVIVPSADGDAGVPEAKPDEPPTFASEKAKDEATIAAIRSLRSSSGGTGVAGQARLLEAASLLRLGQYDDARTAYDAYARSSKSPALQAIAREGVGYALEGKALAQTDAKAREAGLREALKAFESMQTDAKGPRYDYALYHQGRMLALLQQNSRAETMFKKVLEIEPPSPLETTIENRLALMATERSGVGSSAPAPKTPAPTPKKADDKKANDNKAPAPKPASKATDG